MKAIKDRLLWIKKEIVGDKLDTLKRKLTCTSPYEDVVPVQLFEEKKSWIGIPRDARVSFIDEIEDRTIKPSLDFKIEFKGKLRDHQEEVVRRWEELIDNGKNDVILNLEVRSGKTVMAIYIATLLQTPFLVIVPRIPLIGQWIKEILRFTNIRNAQIGVVRQHLCEYEGMICSVGSLQSLWKDKYPVQFKRKWGLVIFDELHRMGSEKFSHVVKMFPARYRLGLTGTLRRSDKMEDVFLYHLGKNIINLDLKEYQPKVKYIVVKYNRSSGHIPKWVKTNIQRRASLISLLADNLDRTKMIANIVLVLCKKRSKILVMSERLRQLDTLEYILSKKLPAGAVGQINGQTSQQERDRIIEACQVILASTQILKEGITIPTARALVFATPLSDPEQAIGRIRNPNPALPEPVVIDIVDTFYIEALGWLEKRKRICKDIISEWVEYGNSNN